MDKQSIGIIVAVVGVVAVAAIIILRNRIKRVRIKVLGAASVDAQTYQQGGVNARGVQIERVVARTGSVVGKDQTGTGVTIRESDAAQHVIGTSEVPPERPSPN